MRLRSMSLQAQVGKKIEKLFLTESEASLMLGMTEKQLRNWRKIGRGLEHINDGDKVFYEVDRIVDHLLARDIWVREKESFLRRERSAK